MWGGVVVVQGSLECGLITLSQQKQRAQKPTGLVTKAARVQFSKDNNKQKTAGSGRKACADYVEELAM